MGISGTGNNELHISVFHVSVCRYLASKPEPALGMVGVVLLWNKTSIS